MTNGYHETAFTPAVRRLQERAGSRDAYAAAGARGGPGDRFTAREAQFISERDGFYLATVSEAGWPYVQFRGGPPGFARVLDETRRSAGRISAATSNSSPPATPRPATAARR